MSGTANQQTFTQLSLSDSQNEEPTDDAGGQLGSDIRLLKLRVRSGVPVQHIYQALLWGISVILYGSCIYI